MKRGNWSYGFRIQNFESSIIMRIGSVEMVGKVERG